MHNTIGGVARFGSTFFDAPLSPISEVHVSQPTASGHQQRGPTVPHDALQETNSGYSENNSTSLDVDADGGVEQRAARRTPNPDDFVRMQADPEFQDLRNRVRRFVFPLTAFFLTWYLLYMLLATYAHAFMATRVFGNINLGVVLGFGQFVTTFGITILYVRFAGRTLDPRAAKIRNELEGAGE
jgi:uncharacterized membrane protein (DUF485 family)